MDLYIFCRGNNKIRILIMMKSTHSYLPLQKFHILPIYGISPKLFKKSVENCSRDREKISHCTLLNSCCKALGFSGGFAGFKKEYSSKLKPFMKDNQLLRFVDLTKQKYPENLGMTKCLRLKKQDISERIFFSGKEMPKKIFTGFNFRYDLHLDDGFYIGNSLYSYMSIDESIKEALNNPLRKISLPNGKERELVDIVIGRYLDKIVFSYFNLIGDQLIKPRKDKYEIQVYYPSDYYTKSDIEEDRKLHKKYLDFFVSRIDSLDKGWVEIIPYNENLVFLKGEDGEYDYVYKNQRDEFFEHQIYAPFLKRADIPSFDNDYHFKRWFYFEYCGFRQKIHHLAEVDFYKNGGNGHTYPGYQALSKEFLIKQENYKYDNKKTSKELDGFHKINISTDKNIMVSDLVTIKHWKDFCKENIDYINKRTKMDNLESINNENDDFPISLTFFDVLKYISWFNKKHCANTRLLSYEEYKKISPNKQKENCEWVNDIEFLYDKKVTKEPPPYMEEEKFQNIIMRFSEDLEFIKFNEINFINSDRFAEWVLEKSCIRSKTLTSFYGDNAIIMSAPPLTSSGKYKYTKIGFRLCYDL